MTKYIDSHSHIFRKYYKNNFESILAESSMKLEYVINVACDYKMIKELSEINYPENILLSAGFHPHEGLRVNQKDILWLENQIINNTKIISIGEIGLDYYRNYVEPKIQKNLFIKQIQLAQKLKLPIIIHCRDAYQDTIEILLSEIKNGFNQRILMHCYSGNEEELRKFLDLGAYISFAGPITFKNNKSALKLIRLVPNNRILSETDCPYLTPVPFRGKTNYPIYAEYVAKKIAEIKKIDFELLKVIIKNNFIKFFDLRS